MYRNKEAQALGLMAALVAGGVVLVVLTLAVWPRYNLYRMEMSGRAALKEAEWSKQIYIEEARAREAAALMQANARVTLAEAEGKAQMVRARAEGQADIERAKAAAEANRIIGASLKGNDEYLRYVWIKGLQDGTGERIYIPTEAGLPILEAGR
ncbi:MAG: hypothetical protein P1U78_01875 [Alcanivoracaceae bacterium]|nr:hypothetical protein [Alcanivoracaceae bacterium]